MVMTRIFVGEAAVEGWEIIGIIKVVLVITKHAHEQIEKGKMKILEEDTTSMVLDEIMTRDDRVVRQKRGRTW